MMHREILIACLPYLAAIGAAVAVTWALLKSCGYRVRISKLRALHRDEAGGVQSLSFVLTLPVFIMIMMFIVQLSQITIAKVVVEYAALAAARSAMVWIPAHAGWGEEEENQVGRLRHLRDETGPDGTTYSVYRVEPASEKLGKIHLAAAMACTPICPSRDTGSPRDHPGGAAAASLKNAYRALDPASEDNPRIAMRIDNKLAYALANTQVEIEVHHKETEPPLGQQYEVPRHWEEFRPNEIGFGDQLYVKVRHDFALLPGPGRILARPASAPIGSDPDSAYSSGGDTVSEKIERRERTYVYTLEATVRLGNEGEKSVLPFVQRLGGAGEASGGEVNYEDQDEDEYLPGEPGTSGGMGGSGEATGATGY